MKHYSFYIILILLLPGRLFGQDLPDGYFKIAAERNPGLQARYKAFEAAMQKIPQVSALPDPNFSFGYFISPVETRVGPQRARFSVNQMFPWFGTLKAQGDAATLTADAKYQEFLDARNRLYYQVAAAYYPLFELEQMRNLEKENERILASYKEIANARFQNGRGALVDVLRVDIMLKEAGTNLSVLDQKRKPLETRFNKLLNLPDNSPVQIAEVSDAGRIAPDYRKSSLLADNPLLEELNLKMKASEAQEEAAIKQGMPRIGAGLDYIMIGKGNMDAPDNGKDALMPMLTVSLPVFRGKYKAARKEARLMRESFTLQKTEVSNRLAASYDMAWFEIQKQYEFIDLYDKQINESEQSLNLLFIAYGNSGKDFEEVLRMQQQLLKYRKERASALAAYHIALAELDYITAKSN